MPRAPKQRPLSGCSLPLPCMLTFECMHLIMFCFVFNKNNDTHTRTHAHTPSDFPVSTYQRSRATTPSATRTSLNSSASGWARDANVLSSSLTQPQWTATVATSSPNSAQRTTAHGTSTRHHPTGISMQNQEPPLLVGGAAPAAVSKSLRGTAINAPSLARVGGNPHLVYADNCAVPIPIMMNIS